MESRNTSRVIKSDSLRNLPPCPITTRTKAPPIYSNCTSPSVNDCGIQGCKRGLFSTHNTDLTQRFQSIKDSFPLLRADFEKVIHVDKVG